MWISACLSYGDWLVDSCTDNPTGPHHVAHVASANSEITLGFHALCLWYICSCGYTVRQERLGVFMVIKKEVTKDINPGGGCS